MSRIVLVSFTPLDASGGVPRWNRDFIAAFPETVHYSWWTLVNEAKIDSQLPEWDKAVILNSWLIKSKKIRHDDIIIVDGFWGLGLENYYSRVVSVCHGNWSHTTKEDVDEGIQPEFPQHHAVQLRYRREHIRRGGRLVAVSEFIADQCQMQWGLEMPVIGNGVRLSDFKPVWKMVQRKRPLIIHGVTNANKGMGHINAVKNAVDADVMLLDEVAEHFGLSKYGALAQADLVIIPSQHEGNSYFCLETLACDVPIVAYAVGLPYSYMKHIGLPCPGYVIGQSERRSVDTFVTKTKTALADASVNWSGMEPRRFVEQIGSMEKFVSGWRNYLKQEFGYDAQHTS